MRELHLEVFALSGREEIHDFFQESLSLPEAYGRNLDALFDVLTDVSEDTKIVVETGGLEPHGLGAYARQLLRVLRDAAEENERLIVEVLA